MTVHQQSDKDNTASETKFLSLLGRLEESYQFVNGDNIDYGPWRRGQNVWVCRSQGLKKSTNSTMAAISSHPGDLPLGPRKRTPELYLRARILCVNDKNDKNDDNDDRILVQYPAGSTYRVRRDLLVPILETDDSGGGTTNDSTILSHKRYKMVVVYPETNDYRRACVTHTGPAEDFWEIGCAQGITCHRVQQTGDAAAATATATATSTTSFMKEKKNAGQRIVVGLDKSKSSIATARQRYPDCHFFMADILDNEDHGGHQNDSDETITTMLQLSPPKVVGVDIGGNRDLEPVLEFLEVVITRWKPRLVLVKSRALHHCIANLY